MEYKIKYDGVADALYIRVRDGEVSDSEEIERGIVIDYDERGEIIGMEIINFSRSKIDLSKLLTGGMASRLAWNLLVAAYRGQKCPALTLGSA